MAEETYDVIVVGAGPGGYVAAIRAAQLGLKTACVEKSGLGGTCLNIGCIPSKALLESSQIYRTMSTLDRHGVIAKDVSLDLSAMMARKSDIVKRMTGGIRGLFRKNKVTHLEGLGHLAGDGVVAITDGKGEGNHRAKHIVIATGSVAVELPNLPFDGEFIVSSTEALTFDTVPEKLVVIGGGAIGLELGSVWNRLGSEVSVLELMPQIVPGMDSEMAAQLQKSLEHQGISFCLESKADTAEVKDGRVHITLSEKGGERHSEVCDRLLVAVGRRANVESLRASEAGVDIDDRGRIVVDSAYKTSVDGVYAIGDVIAGPMLAHKAEEEGVAVIELIAGKAGHVNYDTVPGVVYTHPELASVGLTEEQAREKVDEVKVGKFPFMANGRAHSLEDTEGMVKIIADAKTDRVLGVHILGGRASEMVAEAVLAMEFSSSVEDIARTMHAHPTLPEAMKEAALAVDKAAIHI